MSRLSLKAGSSFSFWHSASASGVPLLPSAEHRMTREAVCVGTSNHNKIKELDELGQ